MPRERISAAGSDEARASSAALLTWFTLQDGIMLGYLFLVWGLLWRAGPGAEEAFCARRVYACISVMLLGCWCSRSPRVLPARLRATLYRLALAGVLLESYLLLREILPLIRPDSVDAELLGLDLRVLSVEPALWLERLNRRPIVEWFAFFYFSYFLICFMYLVTVVWLSSPGRQTTEFSIGTLIVYCAGQLGYMAVPASGPIHYLEQRFHRPVDGGFFWHCVTSTVAAGSAMKDVFPSLHTAAPTWFTLFAFHRARSDPRWRWPARITGFFCANIIFSTMFLRWHYAIDILAGLMLAGAAAVLAPRLAGIEETWRDSYGLARPWTFED